MKLKDTHRPRVLPCRHGRRSLRPPKERRVSLNSSNPCTVSVLPTFRISPSLFLSFSLAFSLYLSLSLSLSHSLSPMLHSYQGPGEEEKKRCVREPLTSDKGTTKVLKTFGLEQLLRPMPESGLDWLVDSKTARQRNVEGRLWVL